MQTKTAQEAIDCIRLLMAKPNLSRKEVVELSGTSLATVARAIKSGDLPVHRIGDRVFVATSSALEWMGVEAVPSADDHHERLAS